MTLRSKEIEEGLADLGAGHGIARIKAGQSGINRGNPGHSLNAVKALNR